jgi:hypothetical protein
VSLVDAIAAGQVVARGRELRRQLELTRSELKAGRLASANTLLERSIRQLDAALEDAKRAGVV